MRNDDGAAAIALPLSDGKRVYGSINMRWIKTAFTVEDFAARYLADLQDAAREIISSLQATGEVVGPRQPFSIDGEFVEVEN